MFESMVIAEECCYEAKCRISLATMSHMSEFLLADDVRGTKSRGFIEIFKLAKIPYTKLDNFYQNNGGDQNTMVGQFPPKLARLGVRPPSRILLRFWGDTPIQPICTVAGMHRSGCFTPLYPALLPTMAALLHG